MTYHKPLPGYEELAEIIEYDPDEGLFFWRRNRGRCVAGEGAGRITVFSYRVIYVAEFDRSFRAARIAWRLQTGEDPGPLEIDHLDRNPSNDRFVNLEPKTRSANEVNTRVNSRSKSGIRGIWQRDNGKWGAKISREKVHRTLGQAFETREAAALAYQEAAAAHARGDW